MSELDITTLRRPQRSLGVESGRRRANKRADKLLASQLRIGCLAPNDPFKKQHICRNKFEMAEVKT